MNGTPTAFAGSIQGLMATNPYWMGVSRAIPRYTAFTNPAKVLPISSIEDSTWSNAVKRSLSEAARFANPFKPVSGSTAAINRAVTETGEAGKNFIQASADAVQAAGAGITSGFKWAVGLAFLGLALYVFTMLSPFLPKPGR